MKNKIGFGGGCHWCTEAVFSPLKGVEKVVQGWISSTDADAGSFSEAVIVRYNPEQIPLHVLIEIHLHTHSSTANHSKRGKYRSAIYTFCDEAKRACEEILLQKQVLFEKPLITKVYPFKSFQKNREEYLNYYQKYQNGAFCQRYIVPKLRLLLKQYGDYCNLEGSKF
jgi:peptide-methionine (S)-S-oxide reductase